MLGIMYNDLFECYSNHHKPILQLRKLRLFKTKYIAVSIFQNKQDSSSEAGRFRFDLINYDKPLNDFCDLVD